VWVREEWRRYYKEGEDAEYPVANLLSDWGSLTFDDIKDHLSDKHEEKWEDREEMSEADVEIASDTDEAIEEDEENSDILSSFSLERLPQENTKRVKRIHLFILEALSNAVETVQSG
jgi:hypothetical protein